MIDGASASVKMSGFFSIFFSLKGRGGVERNRYFGDKKIEEEIKGKGRKYGDFI